MLGPLKAQQGLGAGLGWLWGAAGTPPLRRMNFKLNRAAAFLEWRQLLSA